MSAVGWEERSPVGHAFYARHQPVYRAINSGLTTSRFSIQLKSETLRVAMILRCSRHVAAIRASPSDIFRCCFRAMASS